eukprot:5304075-Pyramimonas_sp.AAC.1
MGAGGEFAVTRGQPGVLRSRASAFCDYYARSGGPARIRFGGVTRTITWASSRHRQVGLTAHSSTVRDDGKWIHCGCL